MPYGFICEAFNSFHICEMLIVMYLLSWINWDHKSIVYHRSKSNLLTLYSSVMKHRLRFETSVKRLFSKPTNIEKLEDYCQEKNNHYNIIRTLVFENICNFYTAIINELMICIFVWIELSLLILNLDQCLKSNNSRHFASHRTNSNKKFSNWMKQEFKSTPAEVRLEGIQVQTHLIMI